MPSSTKIENIDLLIIGAGPAGLATAVEAQRGGISNLLVVEKGPSHSQMIRTYYKEGKRVDAQYAGVEALCFGILCLHDGNRESWHGHGGGSIISGFNSASQAVRHLLQHYLKQPLPPEMVSLDHLLY